MRYNEQVIKLDIDGADRRRWRHDFHRLRWLVEQVSDILSKNGPCIILEPAYVATSKHGYHVRFNVVGGRLSDTEIVTVQSILGSDPIRETLNLYRVRSGIVPWNYLFETKEQDGKVISREHERRDILKLLRGKVH